MMFDFRKSRVRASADDFTAHTAHSHQVRSLGERYRLAHGDGDVDTADSVLTEMINEEQRFHHCDPRAARYLPLSWLIRYDA